MSDRVRIKIGRPIKKAEVSDHCCNASEIGPAGSNRANPTDETQQLKLIEDMESEKAATTQLCQTLRGLVEKVNKFYEGLLAGHREEIAKLSVEIARKILAQKVQEGDYEIESIVKEALDSAPTRENIVVHLNPEDLARCEKIQRDIPDGSLGGIKFVGDANIGRAECMLESRKGMVESFINDRMDQMSEALKKVE